MVVTPGRPAGVGFVVFTPGLRYRRARTGCDYRGHAPAEASV